MLSPGETNVDGVCLVTPLQNRVWGHEERFLCGLRLSHTLRRSWLEIERGEKAGKDLSWAFLGSSTTLSQESGSPQLSQCMLIQHDLETFWRLYGPSQETFRALFPPFCQDPSGAQCHRAASSHVLPFPTHSGQGGQSRPGPIGEGNPAQHPPACQPLRPQTAPLPKARGGMSRLSLLCFTRTGWKETAARPTVSLYSLTVRQYRMRQIVAQI